jgi:7-carboxy-7-deazaguanine synthase
MKPNHLIVSETFYSIQGEGQTIGIPSVFLRLAGCNLLCNSKEWRCDTIEVWQKGKHTHFTQVLTNEQVNELRSGAHLIITGGEPLIHQDNIVDYLNWFRQVYGFTPIVEIETNGTIIPTMHMLDKVDFWNCSPKLANSGEPYSKRVNELALHKIQAKGRKHIFKFVISRPEDMFEINEDYGNIIEFKNAMLMPAGATQEELAKTMPMVAELCKATGFRMSMRAHIDIWNKKTGV